MVNNKKTFSTSMVMDFASLYPSTMKAYNVLDESLAARIRSHERKRIIDEMIADLESMEKGENKHD